MSSSTRGSVLAKGSVSSTIWGSGWLILSRSQSDGEGGVVVGGVVEEGAAEGGAGGWWWVGGGVGDGFGGGDAVDAVLVSRSRWRPRPGRMSW